MSGLAFIIADPETGEPIAQTWSHEARIVQPNVQPVTIIRVRIHPTAAPQSFALALSAGLDVALGAPLYDVIAGIGDASFQWQALPPPAAGTCYIVAAHMVTVRAYPANPAAGVQCFGMACPTGDAPTLTP